MNGFGYVAERLLGFLWRVQVINDNPHAVSYRPIIKTKWGLDRDKAIQRAEQWYKRRKSRSDRRSC